MSNLVAVYICQSTALQDVSAQEDLRQLSTKCTSHHFAYIEEHSTASLQHYYKRRQPSALQALACFFNLLDAAIQHFTVKRSVFLCNSHRYTQVLHYSTVWPCSHTPCPITCVATSNEKNVLTTTWVHMRATKWT